MGAAAVGLFLLAGLLNFPVFSGGGSGIARFAGPTGGYLIGYLLAAVTAGLIAGRPHKAPHDKTARLIAAVTAGFLVVYVPGIIWLKISRGISWERTFLAGFVPFIPGDILKGIAAVFAAKRLRKTAADYLDGK
jgi:biotin transport system substrate-specific component